jgi:hypothetical protein
MPESRISAATPSPGAVFPPPPAAAAAAAAAAAMVKSNTARLLLLLIVLLGGRRLQTTALSNTPSLLDVMKVSYSLSIQSLLVMIFSCCWCSTLLLISATRSD